MIRIPPRTPHLRCIGPAHAETRRRGDMERSSHEDRSCWTGLNAPPEAGALCDVADRNNGQYI